MDHLSVDESDTEIEQEIEKELNDFDFESAFEDSDDDHGLEKKDVLSETISVTSNSLLRATICELERALKDTRRLLFDRDKENSTLRQELEKTRKDLHKEQQQKRKLQQEKDSKVGKEEEERAELSSKVAELSDQLRKLEKCRDTSDVSTDDIVPCCSSMNELIEVKRKLKETEAQLEGFHTNNPPRGEKTVAGKTCRHPQKELEIQLRMKFLRDALFYYMIDFHSDEQMKAILAILNYEDKRRDIIIEAHKMRQRGKKFKVTEVSSRSLTFVQEEG